MNEKLVLFIDTNLIFQCKPLEELDWNLLDYQEILLLVPRKVLEEVDKGKRSPNNRISKRAKNFSSTILNNLSSIDDGLCFQKENPKVSITVTQGLPFSESPPKTLNLEIPDHYIAFEMILYQNAHSDIKIGLLTGDIPLRITARQHEFEVYDIPEDWFLPPEPDERDRQIGQLKEQIKRLEGNSPSIAFGLELEGKFLDSQNVEVPFQAFPPLSDEEIESLISTATTRFSLKKIKENPERIFYPMGMRPIESEIEKFETEEFPTWIQTLREHLKKIHIFLTVKNSSCIFGLLVSNKGFSHATRAILEVSAQGDVELISEDPDIPKIPPPPKPPSMQSLYKALRPDFFYKQLPSLHSQYFKSIQPRDPYKFYCDNLESDDSDDIRKFSCKELRHQQDPEKIIIRIQIKPDSQHRSGLLTYKLSAQNLPIPVREQVPLKISKSIGNTFECAKKQIRALGFPTAGE